MERIDKMKLQARQEGSVKTFVPRIERDRTFRYYVDFSQTEHIDASSSRGPSDAPELRDMPRFAMPRSRSVTFFRYEVWALWRLTTRCITWHRTFLPWLLGWFAVVSFTVGATGLI